MMSVFCHALSLRFRLVKWNSYQIWRGAGVVGVAERSHLQVYLRSGKEAEERS